ncbi:hypothetical protein Tco_0295245 [Tanacetum coccineum]
MGIGHRPLPQAIRWPTSTRGSKLRLELSPALSDINFVSNNTQSSNEDGGSPQFRSSEGCTRTTEATPG